MSKTVFKNVGFDLGTLVNHIKLGQLAPPSLQNNIRNKEEDVSGIF